MTQSDSGCNLKSEPTGTADRGDVRMKESNES